MKKFPRWVRWLVVAALALVAAALTAWVAVVPPLVRRLAEAQLAQMGLPVPSLEVRGLSLHHVQLANVAAGEGERFRIGAVAAHYTIGGLLRKRLRTIELVGLETEVRVRDGTLDLGPLANLRSEGGGPTPFERIELRSCVLRLVRGGQVVAVLFSGHVANAGEAGLRVDLSVSVGGTDARLAGVVDTSAGEFAVRLEGKSRSLPLRLPVSGTVAFVVRAERKAGATKVEAQLSAQGPLRLTALSRPVTMGAFSVRCTAELDERLEPKTASLDVELGELSVEGLDLLPVASASLTASLAEGAAKVEVSADGSSWRLESLSGSFAGIAALLRGNEKAAGIEGKLDWKVVVPEPGRLPIAASLAHLADLSGLGPLECSGSGSVSIALPASGRQSGWDWRLEAPQVRVALGKSSISSPRFGAALSGLEAEARLAIVADPQGVRGRLLSGSRLVVDSATAAHAGGEVSLSAAPAPAVQVVVTKEGGEFTLTLEREGISWKATIPEARVIVKGASAKLPAGPVVTGAEAELAVSLGASPEALTLRLAPGSRLTLSGAELNGIKVVSTPGKPLASLTLGGDGGRLTLSQTGGETHWTAAFSSLEATAEAREVEALGRRVRLERPRLAARFNLDAGERLAVVNRTGPWEATCEGVELVARGHRLRLGPLAFEVAERGKSPLVAAGFEGGELVGGRLALDIRSAKPLELKADKEAAFRAESLAIGLEAKADGHRRSAKAEFTASGIALKAAQKLKGGAASLELANGRAKATVTIPDERSGVTADFAFGPATVKASAKGILASLPRVALSGTVRAGALKVPQVDAQVEVADAHLAHPSLGLEVRGVSATVPVVWHTAPGRSGLFRVGEIRLGAIKLPGPSGAAEVDDGRLVATVTWKPLKGAKVTASASLGQEAGMMRGRLDFSLPLFELKDQEAVSRLVPQAKGLMATGTFGAEGVLRLEGSTFKPDVTVTVLDGAFRSRKWEMDAEGVFATVRLDSLTPPLTPRKELQVALVKRAKMGKLEVEDGFVAFRLEPKKGDGETVGWVAYLQRGEWGWVGGRLFAEKVSFDPKAPRYEFTVHARDLKLSKLLALIPGDRAAGVGAVSGQVPIAIEGWPNIQFGNGSFRTTPGQKGWIQIKDTKPLEQAIAQVARASVPRGLSDQVKTKVEEDIRSRILEALHDFEYDELRLDFINREGKFVARAFMKGRGRFGHKQEFGGVTLNFPGLDAFLRDAILVSREFFSR